MGVHSRNSSTKVDDLTASLETSTDHTTSTPLFQIEVFVAGTSSVDNAPRRKRNRFAVSQVSSRVGLTMGAVVVCLVRVDATDSLPHTDRKRQLCTRRMRYEDQPGIEVSETVVGRR